VRDERAAFRVSADVAMDGDEQTIAEQPEGAAVAARLRSAVRAAACGLRGDNAARMWAEGGCRDDAW
jgi:hypothetical protein